jgi:flagellar biosynthesis/type III secretory pathway protein FliH
MAVALGKQNSTFEKMRAQIYNESHGARYTQGHQVGNKERQKAGYAEGYEAGFKKGYKQGHEMRRRDDFEQGTTKETKKGMHDVQMSRGFDLSVLAAVGYFSFPLLLRYIMISLDF